MHIHDIHRSANSCPSTLSSSFFLFIYSCIPKTLNLHIMWNLAFNNINNELNWIWKPSPHAHTPYHRRVYVHWCYKFKNIIIIMTSYRLKQHKRGIKKRIMYTHWLNLWYVNSNEKCISSMIHSVTCSFYIFSSVAQFIKYLEYTWKQ